MNNLSIFLVVDDGDNSDKLYWFGRPSPVVNQTTIYSGLHEYAAVTEPEARERINGFLADPQETLSASLGIDQHGRIVALQRAKHHRD